jgi:hypothetical protein
MVLAQPPPLFSSPAVAHLLPPGPAQSSHRHLSVFSTCPFSPLQDLSDPAASPVGHRASVAPCPIAASHLKKRKLQKPPSPSSSSHHRNTSTVAAGLASLCPGRLVLPMRDPFPPPLHCSSYPPSTRALTSFNGLNHHSPPPPLLRPFNHPSPAPESLSHPL